MLQALSNPLFLKEANVLPSNRGEEQSFFVISGLLLLLYYKKPNIRTIKIIYTKLTQLIMLP